MAIYIRLLSNTNSTLDQVNVVNGIVAQNQQTAKILHPKKQSSMSLQQPMYFDAHSLSTPVTQPGYISITRGMLIGVCSGSCLSMTSHEDDNTYNKIRENTPPPVTE
jgi:hypothetical protein